MTTLQFTEGSGVPEPFLQRKQLLNHIVDGLAQTRPYSVWAEIPKSLNTYDAGFRRVTYRDLANAINGVAWWLSESLGQGTNFETLAYFGPWDIRYVVLPLGAVKAGYKMVFPSPKYSLAGLESLMEDLDVRVFLTVPNTPPVASAYLETHKVPVLSVPTVADFLDKEYRHYSFPKAFASSRMEPLVCLHTSGSTSHPKPIIWTHDFAASFLQQQQVSPPPGFDSMDKYYHGTRLLLMMPPFHAGSMFGNLLVSIPNQTTVIYPLPDATVSAETLVQILQHTNVDIAAASPNVIERLGVDPALKQLVIDKLHVLSYAGGDISREAGDKLAEGLTFFCAYASTEAALIPTIRPRVPSAINHWKRWQPHPRAQIRFEHLAGDEYEAVIVRNSTKEEEQPLFKVFPHLNEWRTKDIFFPDPLEEGSWIYRSRIDDLIIFADGVSFNPLEYEQQICSHPDIQAALMFGTQRPKAALLVELADPQDFSDKSLSEMLDRLWPIIEKANELCMEQSVITKARVLFTSPGRVLPRAGKGTVQRAKAFQLYKADLDALYS